MVTGKDHETSQNKLRSFTALGLFLSSPSFSESFTGYSRSALSSTQTGFAFSGVQSSALLVSTNGVLHQSSSSTAGAGPRLRVPPPLLPRAAGILRPPAGTGGSRPREQNCCRAALPRRPCSFQPQHDRQRGSYGGGSEVLAPPVRKG